MKKNERVNADISKACDFDNIKCKLSDLRHDIQGYYFLSIDDPGYRKSKPLKVHNQLVVLHGSIQNGEFYQSHQRVHLPIRT